MEDKTNLIKVTTKELSRNIFAPGDIYYQSPSGKLIKVSEFGDVLSIEQLKKYEKQNAELVCDQKIHPGIVAKGSMNFLKLLNATNETERVEARDVILKWATPLFWSRGYEVSLLDLILICKNSFYHFSEQVSFQFYETSVTSYKRSALIGSYAVFFALAAGYTDFKYLRDLYHVCYLFDFALDESGPSFTLKHAAELERKQSGEGVRYLIFDQDKGPELDLFVEHPMNGVSMIRQRFQQFFHNQSIFDLILRHHEKISGKGFPSGVCEKEISDIERIIIFLSHKFDYENIELTSNDGIGAFKKIFSMSGEEVLSRVLFKKLKIVFEKIEGELAA